MLGNLFQRKKKTDEEIKKERIDNLNLMLEKSPKFKKLIGDDQSGWVEFCALLDDYTDKCMKRKAITALDRADDATIYQLKLLDHEVFIINWIKRIPEQFINQTEELVKKQSEE